jgi:nucleoside 2-deoxyribosyltransferase
MEDKGMRVYLAGMIPKGESLIYAKEWRTKVINYYSNWKNSGKNYGNICFLNPLNGEDQISDDGLSSNIPSKAILTKDYAAVRSSDLCIFNMDQFGDPRIPFGTILEIGFAYEKRIPSIMITKDDVYKKHPFISNMIDMYFETIDDLLNKKAINIFYKAFNSASS